jgi:hypothetical protein
VSFSNSLSKYPPNTDVLKNRDASSYHKSTNLLNRKGDLNQCYLFIASTTGSRKHFLR